MEGGGREVATPKSRGTAGGGDTPSSDEAAGYAAGWLLALLGQQSSVGLAGAHADKTELPSRWLWDQEKEVLGVLTSRLTSRMQNLLKSPLRIPCSVGPVLPVR